MVFLSWFDIKRLLETLITKLFYIKKKKKHYENHDFLI